MYMHHAKLGATGGQSPLLGSSDFGRYPRQRTRRQSEATPDHRWQSLKGEPFLFLFLCALACRLWCRFVVFFCAAGAAWCLLVSLSGDVPVGRIGRCLPRGSVVNGQTTDLGPPAAVLTRANPPVRPETTKQISSSSVWEGGSPSA